MAKEELCNTSSLVCGSCIKAITTTNSFSAAEIDCFNQTEFENLHIIRNLAQWFYDTNTTGSYNYWVI